MPEPEVCIMPLRRTEMHRKLAFTIVMIVLLAITGTVQRPVAAADAVTIRWLSWWDSTYGKAYLDSVQDRFTQKTGIKVERVDTPWGSMFDTMASNVQQKPATFDVLGMEGCC